MYINVFRFYCKRNMKKRNEYFIFSLKTNIKKSFRGQKDVETINLQTFGPDEVQAQRICRHSKNNKDISFV